MSTQLADLQAMSLSELDADLKRLGAELQRTMAKADEENRDLTPGEAQRFDNIHAAIEARNVVYREKLKELSAQQQRVNAGNPDNPLGTHPLAPNQNYNRPGGPDEDRGRKVIDQNFRSGVLPDHAAEKATALIEAGSVGERSLAGRWAAAAGAPAYRQAFAKLAADPSKGHLLWTPEEGDAYRAVAAVSAELEGRAMSTTANAGGAMIPLSLDPAIMLTSAGSNNPLRQLATVRQTMTNTWQGVSSAGATSEWKVEAAQSADGSPVLASPEIDIFLGDTFVPYSFEVGDDAENFLAELVEVMRDSADNLMATAYTTGDGTNAPEGIVTGLAGTASEINTTGSEVIVDSDAYALQNALPARFSANATWQANIAVMNTFRQFETTNGAIQFPELRENPPTLLGKRFYENSNMDGAIDAAATANNYVMIYGDIAKAFTIVDRAGSRLEFIDNLVGANGRPTGQRGAFLWFRTGSGVVNIAAARLLDVPTTA